ncbi:zinc ribbon domain-containing protein [Thomasclavelia sp.]|uniref:zinc ribbon domain-containing protein n=1 Tax=Thomasclavelia sp. TaxID=3025757 RepID=UPI0025CC2B84|nr:zinc ribbon domain-containing protein [Thomasclavelia sp.]
MKKCPHCKKNIPDSAKVCPYCGTRLEKGYRPMKRTNAFPNYLYLILAFILMFSPILSTLMFGSLLDSDTATSQSPQTPDSAITLGPLEKSDEEKVAYYFGSLDNFDKLVTNSDEYVKKIKAVEADLKELTKKYGDVEISKDYDFYVTENNNVHTNITYILNVSDQEEIKVSLSYDLLKKANRLEIKDEITGFENYEAMKVNDQSYQLSKDIVTLLNGEKEFACYQDVSKQFNELDLDLSKERLGNYGLAVNKQQKTTDISMRILGRETNYRLQLTYQCEIDLDKLI